MIRKQLYISDEQAPKAKARELGAPEAESVRRRLDGMLLDGERGRRLARPGAAKTLDGSLEMAYRLAESHRFSEGYRFCRDEH